MRNWIILSSIRWKAGMTVCLLLCILNARAQEPLRSSVEPLSSPAMTSSVEPMATSVDTAFPSADYRPTWDREMPQDSLHLPTLTYHGQMPWAGRYPITWSGVYGWDLHQGLNVSLGASVFTGLGNHNIGTGFSQNLSLMYAQPITSNLSLAVGGYVKNVSWDHRSFRDGGVSAVLSYRFNDHWEAYLYGQKSFTNNRMPLPFYDMYELGDRLGAAIRYNVSPAFSIQVNIETREQPSNAHLYGWHPDPMMP